MIVAQLVKNLPAMQETWIPSLGWEDPPEKGKATPANILAFQKNIYFCFIDYAKAFGCVDHNKLWKILKEMGIPDYLTCLLRNLYAGEEEMVRNEHRTDWFQIGKRETQSKREHLTLLFNLELPWVTHGALTLSWKDFGRRERNKKDLAQSRWRGVTHGDTHQCFECYSWNSIHLVNEPKLKHLKR